VPSTRWKPPLSSHEIDFGSGSANAVEAMKIPAKVRSRTVLRFIVFSFVRFVCEGEYPSFTPQGAKGPKKGTQKMKDAAPLSSLKVLTRTEAHRPIEIN
jgi:hypothetical protein